jgi:hypothetical protein
LTYSNNQYSEPSTSTPIAPYPFNFEVEPQQVVQQNIQQQNKGSWLTVYAPITIDVSIPSISIVAILAYVWRRMKSKDKEREAPNHNKPKKRTLTKK